MVLGQRVLEGWRGGNCMFDHVRRQEGIGSMHIGWRTGLGES